MTNSSDYSYTDQELQQLHAHLYKITGEVVRVCERLGIGYFIIGGTAIGAYFWDGMIPWDDDIDIGMTRDDYERFLREAPAVLGDDYFLQWVQTDGHTPAWFAKVREHHTLFAETMAKDVRMHQGIFVDVFPFDKIPKNRWLERLQWHLVNFFNGCFIGKEIWQWKHFGHCDLPVPRRRGVVPCLVTRLVNTVLSKKGVYKCLKWSQTLFNNGSSAYCKNVVTTNDTVSIDHVKHPRKVCFGPLEVAAPRDLEAYLHTHYPVLRKHLPKEEQINHRPSQLVFDTRKS